MHTTDPETYLPPELFHLILDSLDDEKFTLSSCSTVNKGWRYFCRPRLFHTIDLNGACRNAVFERFVIFLDEHPDIGSVMRDIRFYAQDTWATDCLLSLGTLSHILHSIPNIRNLTLEDVNLIECTNFSPSDDGNPYRPRDVHRLVLKGVKLPVSLPLEYRLRNFHSLLNLFNGIGDLRLLCCRFGLDQGALLTPRTTLKPSVSSIFVSCWTLADNPSILEALQSGVETSSLRSLGVQCCRGDDVKSIGDLIRTSSPTLEQFTINIDPMVQAMVTRDESPDSQFWQTMPLASCPALRDVTIEGFVLSGIFAGNTRASFAALLDILTLLPSTISTITILVRPATPLALIRVVMATLEWSLLEDELARFEGLGKVEFRVSNQGSLSTLAGNVELVRDIRARLPKTFSEDVRRSVE